MIIVTKNEIENKKIEELGMVMGSVVKTKNIGSDILASLKTLVGGEIPGYTKMMNDARNVATTRMINEAEKINADAIVAVRYTTSSVMGGAAEIIAYGTAIKFL